ncbi:MAG: DNA alkylation repair protein [Chloroflexi bacterium]|nr:DNA alkylation repair protein [Chloroflexota bacterium]
MSENFSDPSSLPAEIDAHLQTLPDHKTATIRAMRREYSKRLAKAEAQTVLAVALGLMGYPTFEHRFVGYELVHHHRPALRSLGRTELEQLGRSLDSWYSVDTFATYLAGPAWRAGQVPDSLIHEWAGSQDRWWRRTALVCTVALNTKARGGRGDVPRTLAVCRLLAADHDDMVVKALSWALRALILYDPAAVRTFLDEHQAVLAARIPREVRHKLDTDLKNPRKTR